MEVNKSRTLSILVCAWHTFSPIFLSYKVCQQVFFRIVAYLKKIFTWTPTHKVQTCAVMQGSPVHLEASSKYSLLSFSKSSDANDL